MRIHWLFLILIFCGGMFAGSSRAGLRDYFIFAYFDEEVVGSRARGMGHSELFGYNGANAVFSNPAGLIDANMFMLDIGMNRWNGDNTNAYLDQIGIFDGRYKNRNRFTHFSAAMPIPINKAGIKLAAGVGYRLLYDLTFEHHYFFGGGYGSDVNLLHISEGGYYVFTEAVAIGFGERFTLGINANQVIRGSASLKLYYAETADPDELAYTSESDLGGTFFTLAMGYRFNDMLQTGIRIKTPMKARMYNIKILDEPTWYYPEGGFPILEEDRIYDIPLITTAGVLGKPLQNLSLTGEIIWANYSNYRVMNDPSIVPDLVDGFGYLIGGEFVYRDFVSLRAGFFHEPIPLRQQDNSRKPAASAGITYGLGFELYNLTLDLFSESSSRAYNFDQAPASSGGPYYELKETYDIYGVTLGYAFDF